MLAVFFQADGYSDPFYVRFTTPKQHSLILGTSKAAHGIQPTEIKEVLPDEELFNYSFTIAHSPYGPAYLKGIQRKLQKNSNNGLFIVAVDPWSIADSNEDPNDESQFDENKSFLNKLTVVDAKPNIPYLLSFYKNSYLKFFERDPVAFLHDDGWFEVNLDMHEDVVSERILNKANWLKKRGEEFQFSQTRLSYLYKIIEYLKSRGSVYMVNLPVHPDLTEINNSVTPNYIDKMKQLAKETQTPYLDMSTNNGEYIYTDGIHLYKDSGKLVSQKIARWIKEIEDSKKK